MKHAHRRHSSFATFVRLGSALVLALPLAGWRCAGSRAQVPQVEDAWLARAPETALAPVYEARAALRQAKDGVVRAEVAREDARQEVAVAESLLAAAKESAVAVERQLQLARSSGSADRILRAQAALEDRKLSVELAEGRLELLRAEERVRAAGIETAKAEVELRGVLLEKAEYDVLREQNDTRVSALDGAQFDRAINDRNARLNRQRAEESDRHAAVARQRAVVDGLEARQAVGGSGRE